MATKRPGKATTTPPPRLEDLLTNPALVRQVCDATLRRTRWFVANAVSSFEALLSAIVREEQRRAGATYARNRTRFEVIEGAKK